MVDPPNLIQNPQITISDFAREGTLCKKRLRRSHTFSLLCFKLNQSPSIRRTIGIIENMKFREVRDRVVTRKCTPPLSEHHADPSPLLDRNATVYLTQMRDNIKNSFTDKLSFMKSNARIYDFEQNPKVLKATSHLTGVPALLPP